VGWNVSLHCPRSDVVDGAREADHFLHIVLTTAQEGTEHFDCISGVAKNASALLNGSDIRHGPSQLISRIA
jgi:hypothetical protein